MENPIKDKYEYWNLAERNWIYRGVMLRSHIQKDPTTRSFEVQRQHMKYLAKYFKNDKGDQMKPDEKNTPI